MMGDRAVHLQYSQAQQATINAELTEPRAIAAVYDRAAKQVIVKLTSGATFSFPVETGLLNGVFGSKRWMAQRQAEWQQTQVS